MSASPGTACWKCDGTGVHRHRKRQQNPAAYDARHPAGPPRCSVCSGSGHLGQRRLPPPASAQANEDGVSPEEVLALARDGELQKLQLLPPRAVLGAVDRHCSTALHWSAGNGHLALSKWLVHELGADVTAANRTGRTPLHLAARNGHLEVCRWLVDQCSVPADVHAKHGVSALQLATWQNQVDVCRWLVDTCNVNIQEMNEFGCTAVHWLGMSSGVNADSTHALPHWFLQRGLDFCKRNNQGHTPLHKAAFSGHECFCRWLVETVGLLDAHPDESGNYAADLAEMGEHPKLAAWLRQEASAERRRASAILQLPPEAGMEQIRSTYRSMARRYHPDKLHSQQRTASAQLPTVSAEDGGSGDLKAVATSSKDTEADIIGWHQLQQAYEILSQPAIALTDRANCAENEYIGRARADLGLQRNVAHDLRLMLRMVADGDEAEDEGGTEALSNDSADVERRTQAKRHLAAADVADRIDHHHQQQQNRPTKQRKTRDLGADISPRTDTEVAPRTESGLGTEDDEGCSVQSLFKARLAAVLLEYHNSGIPLANLPKKYRQIWGVEMPRAQVFRKRKMVQVLRNMPDVVRVEQTHANHTILHCVKTRDDLKLAIEDSAKSLHVKCD